MDTPIEPVEDFDQDPCPELSDAPCEYDEYEDPSECTHCGGPNPDGETE